MEKEIKQQKLKLGKFNQLREHKIRYTKCKDADTNLRTEHSSGKKNR